MTLCKKILNVAAPLVLATTITTNTQAQRIHSSVERLIRPTPYETILPGAARNWQESRLAIMTNNTFCEEGKNVFIDRNGFYLGSAKRTTFDEEELSRAEASQIRRQNQRKLDSWRRNYAREGNTVAIHPHGGAGYPFAYSCEEKNNEFIRRGVKSYFGLLEESLIQQGWRSYNIDEPVSVREAFRMVEQNFPQFSNHTRRLLRGQYVIESGGDRDANSRHAKGILQIVPYNLRRLCDIKEDDWLNEFAQIHCAYTLLERDAQRLRPLFENVFSHLPHDKKEQLFANLLAHGYHAGPRYFREMMANNRRGAATRFYARNHQQFSADDIAKGMLFHNYAADDEERNFQQLRNASLKYVSDANASYLLLIQKADELGLTVQ